MCVYNNRRMPEVELMRDVFQRGACQVAYVRDGELRYFAGFDGDVIRYNLQAGRIFANPIGASTVLKELHARATQDRALMTAKIIPL